MTLIVTMAVTPERQQEFLDLAANTARKVHENEPGTVLYALTKHPAESHTYIWIERYRDQRALEAHSAAPYLAAALGKLPEYLANPPELLQLAQIVPQ